MIVSERKRRAMIRALRDREGRKVGDGQCVDLFRLGVKIIEGGNGFDSIPLVASAIDIWKAAPKDAWQHVRPTGTGAGGWEADLPDVGAIVIFEPTPGNRHGHVAFALGKQGATPGTFLTIDQNYSRPGRVTIEAHRMTGVRGWLYLRSDH